MLVNKSFQGWAEVSPALLEKRPYLLPIMHVSNIRQWVEITPSGIFEPHISIDLRPADHPESLSYSVLYGPDVKELKFRKRI